MLEGEGRGFARNFPARAASSSHSRIWIFGMWAATLDHEVFNDAVEVEAIVMPHVNEFDKISDRIGGAAVK
jgi:hypothetical protein